MKIFLHAKSSHMLKVHFIDQHIMEFLEMEALSVVGLCFYSEQTTEASHYDFKVCNNKLNY